MTLQTRTRFLAGTGFFNLFEMVLLCLQVFAYRSGDFPAAYHGGNNQVWPGYAIPGSEDACTGGGAGFFIHHTHQTIIVSFQAGSGFADDRVWPIAQGLYSRVYRYGEVGTF